MDSLSHRVLELGGREVSLKICRGVNLYDLRPCRRVESRLLETSLYDLAPNGPSAKKVRSDFSHFLQGTPDRLFRQSVHNPSKIITFEGKVLFYLAARGAAPSPPTFALDPLNHRVLLRFQFRMLINQNLDKI